MNNVQDRCFAEIMKMTATELATITGGTGSCIDPQGGTPPSGTGTDPGTPAPGDTGSCIDPLG